MRAESWYTNLDKLIDGVNADGRMKTLYSTPTIYLAAKHAEGLSWPLKTDDFFPCQSPTTARHNDPLSSLSLHAAFDYGDSLPCCLFLCLLE